MRRFSTLSVFLIAIVLVSIVAAGGTWYWARSTLPAYEGADNLPGLDSSVTVVRDANAVPHIYADSMSDAYRALGYVHAQDRLWQMEAMRRLGRGRLAEILGPIALPSDRMMRLLGISRLADRQFRILEPETRRALEAYAEGVNGWMNGRTQSLPVEFSLLGFEPEPWMPSDSLLWGRIMAYQLSGSWRDELLRAQMLSRISDAQILSFWYPDLYGQGVASLRSEGHRPLDSAFDDKLLSRLAALAPPLPSAPTGASNAWAVNGAMSGTGKPLLANDPHLGFGLPIMWYLAHIDTPELTLTGATVPGVPFTILGHNGQIAWGMTTTQSDQQDLFIERLTPDGASYSTPGGGTLKIEHRRETISVKGQADEVLDVRETRHGPVVSDLVGSIEEVAGPGTVLSLSAVFLAPDDTTPDAFYRMNRSTDWPSFYASLARFQSPQQNIVYADVAGNIGFTAPGNVPVRGSGRGRFPVPGWTGESDWLGYLPFRELPTVLNPPAERIVSANNKIVADDYPHFISDDWAPPHRARRIFRLLDALAPHSAESTTDVQLDFVSEMARELVPLMTAITPHSRRTIEVIGRLARWDGTMSRDSAEPLIFYAWLKELNRAIYADEMGSLFTSVQGLRPRFIISVLKYRHEWCDDQTTTETETCGEILEGALARALASLDVSGKDGGGINRWGDAHKAVFRHPILASIPFLGAELGLREIPVNGGNYTVNRAGFRIADPAAPFADIHGPGYRAVYDLGDLSRSRFVVATGQSGNPFSDHYDDLLATWSDGRHVTIGAPRLSVQGNGGQTLFLTPAQDGENDRPAPMSAPPLIEKIADRVLGLVRAWAGTLESPNQ